MTKHTLYFSDACIELQCNDARIGAALERRWLGAVRSMLPVRKTYRAAVTVASKLRIAFEDEVLWDEHVGEEPEHMVELYLYRGMLAEHRRRFGVFHGAAVTSNRESWVFCGRSGAGKSTLSTAALRRGYRYFTDEFVVTDGNALWGWPRTPEIDVQPSYHRRAPRWLVGFEPVDAQGTARYPLRLAQVARDRAPAERVHLVHLEPGITTRLRPIAPAEALRHWHEAAFHDSPVALGSLVGAQRVWHAQWADPDELLDELERASRAGLESAVASVP